MKNRLQFNRHFALYNSREEAITALNNRIADTSFIPLIGEPIVLRYKNGQDDNGKDKIEAILAIGKKAGTTLSEREYHIVDTADLDEKILAEAGRIDSLSAGTVFELDAVNGRVSELSAVTESFSAATDDFIGRIIAAAGLDDDGSYIHDHPTHYIDEVASLADADHALDAAVFDVFTDVNTLSGAVISEVARLDSKIDAATVSSDDKTVVVTPSATGTDLSVNIDGITIVKDRDGVLGTKLTLTKLATPSSTNVREEYALVDNNGNHIGDTVKVYKDSSLQSVELITIGDREYLRFTYILADGSTSVVDVDVSSFLSETEFRDGLIVNDHKVYVLKDPASDDFLSVSSNGVKVSGVRTAINKVSDDAANSANTLNNAIEAEKNRAIAAENSISGNVSSLSASVVSEINRATSAENSISGQVTTLSGSVITFSAATVNELARLSGNTDGIQEELDKTQTGAGLENDGSYRAVENANYISDAVSLRDADAKLDVALKKVSDDATASANTLNGSVETEKNRAIAAENSISGNVNSLSGVVASLSAGTVAEVNRAISAETALDGRIRNLENTTVTGENAIDVESTELNKKVTLVIDSSDNVLSQSRGGLKTTLGLNYDSNNSKVQLLGNGGTVISEFDSSDFIKDGMIESVTFDPATNILLIVWNTAAGHDSTRIDLSGLVDVYTVAPESGTYMEINDYVVKLNVDVTNGLASYNYARNISGAVVTEKERATGVENEIKNNFNSFSSATQTSITNLNNALTTEIANRISGDTYLDGKIQNEITRATGVENSLNTKIESETTRATTAENSLNTKIESEITRATGAENSLRTSITTAVDDLTLAYTQADQDIVDAYTAAISQESESRIDTDNMLLSLINGATGDITNLETRLNNEISRATNTENLISGSVINVNNNVSNLSGQLSTFSSSTVNEINNINNRINNLDSKTISGENAIKTNVSGSDTKVSLLINGSDKVLSQDNSGLYTQLSIELSNDGKALYLKGKNGATISTIDTTSFVKDGMLDNVVFDGDSKTLKFTFNTDSGKQQIDVPLGSLVDIYTVSATSASYMIIDNYKIGLNVDVTNGLASYSALRDVDNRLNYLSGTVQTIDGRVTENTTKINNLSGAVTNIDYRLNSLSGTVQTIDGRVTENTTKINNLSGSVINLSAVTRELSAMTASMSGRTNGILTLKLNGVEQGQYCPSASTSINIDTGQDVSSLSGAVVTNKTNIELLSASTVNIKNIVDALSGSVVENRNLINNISANTYNKTEINNLISGASQMKYATSSTLANLTLSEFLTVAKIAGDTTLSIATTGLPSLPANGVAERHVIIENIGTTDAVVTVSSDSRIKFTLGNRIAIDRNGGIGELNALITYDGSSYTIYVITI